MSKKSQRIVALSFIMVLCLLVHRLAEHRLRQRLEQTDQTIPKEIQQTHQATNNALDLSMFRRD